MPLHGSRLRRQQRRSSLARVDPHGTDDQLGAADELHSRGTAPSEIWASTSTHRSTRCRAVSMGTVQEAALRTVRVLLQRPPVPVEDESPMGPWLWEIMGLVDIACRQSTVRSACVSKRRGPSCSVPPMASPPSQLPSPPQGNAKKHRFASHLTITVFMPADDLHHVLDRKRKADAPKKALASGVPHPSSTSMASRMGGRFEPPSTTDTKHAAKDISAHAIGATVGTSVVPTATETTGSQE